MKANYHTHTPRCHHAEGSEEEHIKAALKAGLHTLGFSDHSPYIFEGDYVSGIRMLPAEMPEYFNTLLALREKYRGKIDIKIGFETEYYPRFFSKLQDEYRKYPLDYMILGQHFVGNEGTDDAEPAFKETSDQNILTRFSDQCIEAMQTDRFTYFAHPDFLNFVPTSPEDFDKRDYEYERLIRASMQTKTPLEINFCGIRYRRHYPNRRFWEIAGALGAEVVIGFDSHAPSQIAREDELLFAKKLICDCSLNFIDSFPLKNPVF